MSFARSTDTVLGHVVKGSLRNLLQASASSSAAASGGVCDPHVKHTVRLKLSRSCYKQRSEGVMIGRVIYTGHDMNLIHSSTNVSV